MKEIFDEVLETFENDDIKKFFINKCVPTIPQYVYHVPASSSGKYHSQISLGEGGLMRHTIGLVRIMNYMFEVESVEKQFTSRERDLLRVAGLMHDSRKSGTQEDFEHNKYTKFDHPLQAANVIRGLDGLNKKEIEFIAHCIESHMGVWNTDKRCPGVVLPKPQDKYQIILHLCDYIISRRDVELKFDNNLGKNVEIPDINEWKLDFGKYKGYKLIEINKEHPDYIEWLKNQNDFNRQPCKDLIDRL